MDVELGPKGHGTVTTEVVAKAKRRRFSAKYKRDILRNRSADRVVDVSRARLAS